MSGANGRVMNAELGTEKHAHAENAERRKNREEKEKKAVLGGLGNLE